MANKLLSINKVVYLTLLVLIATASWFLYDHFHRPENFKIPVDFNMASKRPVSYASAVQQAAPAVVSIKTTKITVQQLGVGSGIIIDPLGHVLTNNHVIEGAQEITVKLADGRSSHAKIIGTDPQTDLAILQIDIPELPVVKLGTSDNLQVGDIVLAIGNPLGLNSSVTQGIISAIGTMQNLATVATEYNLADTLIQTDAAINLGSSGGALIDAHGQVIGINTAIFANFTGSQGIGFAIPIDHAKVIATQLISHGKVTRGWIGAQLTEIPVEMRQRLDYRSDIGIYVQDTIRNSPAQKSGILPGDIITKINNAELKDINATLKLIANLQPESTYNLEVLRDGKATVYAVTAAAKQ